MTMTAEGALARYKEKSGITNVPTSAIKMLEAIFEEIKEKGTTSSTGSCSYGGSHPQLKLD